MGNILDGKKLADRIREDVKKEVQALNRIGFDVGLAVLLAGDNPASLQYFQSTLNACKKVGVTAYEFRLPENVTANEILNIVHTINIDERINGLLALMPLPAHINARRIINSIVPEKDVDGLGAISVGRLAADESSFQLFKQNEKDLFQQFRSLSSIWSFLPCTPFGVIRLLEFYDIGIKGKHVVIIGKSLAVGKPLANMFLAKEATVTVCHRETVNLAKFTRQADILCSATGRAGLIRGSMVKNGAVVIDVGINILKDGSIVGDVDFSSVSRKASMITPVPGGVGPVTIAMLLENTVRSAVRNELFKSPLMMG
ncbi:MAG: bifunctional 5,10-methylenetetrahydrofolate dehydrogenase/5,10-methenyltetrahydrofolate cyclohydrolase [Nitrospirae bacterium]|nr:bifunctional 5,10-methylenetetrahydrofolate dehydrogenase/5,10-methenyltetrahydrofolate cyclohydrolase [Nitrospirota bacterium]